MACEGQTKQEAPLPPTQHRQNTSNKQTNKIKHYCLVGALQASQSLCTLVIPFSLNNPTRKNNFPGIWVKKPRGCIADNHLEDGL